MNSKGSFSAIVAVSLVVLIAAIGFTFYSNGVSQKALLEQQDALEVRQHFTQVRVLLDKAAAKALYESKNSSACIPPTSNYATNVRAYFRNALNASNDSVFCELPNLASISPLNDSEYSTLLKCSKQDSVNYSSTVKFKKKLAGTFPDCTVSDTQGSPAFQELPLP